jgi:uncharacterized protein YndB with AHSA1/START domain
MNGTLEVTTPSDFEIALTRVFDAPPRLVYEAYTNPELLKRWLGFQSGWTLDICEVDLKVGGTYRYLWRAPNRPSMEMSGVYQEIVPGNRIVTTEAVEDPSYECEAEVTINFADRDGKTRLTITLLYDSKEIRDRVLKSPMEQGLSGSFDKLAELLA